MDEGEQKWLEDLVINKLSLGARIREVVPRLEEGFSNEDVEVRHRLFLSFSVELVLSNEPFISSDNLSQ